MVTFLFFSLSFFLLFLFLFLFYISMANYQSIGDANDRESSIASYRPNSEYGSVLDDTRRLLTNDTENLSICHTVYDYEEEPGATITSCAINLANTILGTGMLAMVYTENYIIEYELFTKKVLAFCLGLCRFDTWYFLDFVRWMYFRSWTLSSFAMCY